MDAGTDRARGPGGHGGADRRGRGSPDDGSGDSGDDDAGREPGSVYAELARFVGGLVLIALGLIVSFGVITALIGVPMMVAGYALYRSSVLSGRHEQGVRMDYREGRREETERDRGRSEGRQRRR